MDKWILLVSLAALVMLLLIFGGAPLNVSHINRPWVFNCGQYCIPLLTVNPLGQAYSRMFFSALTRALLPVYGAGSIATEGRYLDELERTGSRVIDPSQFTGNILAASFTAAPIFSFLLSKKA